MKRGLVILGAAVYPDPFGLRRGSPGDLGELSTTLGIDLAQGTVQEAWDDHGASTGTGPAGW